MSHLIESGQLTLKDVEEARKLLKKEARMSNLFLAILANHLWQSLLVAAVLGGLTLLLRRNSARVRYFLWLAASLKFLVPFAALAVLGTSIPWQPQVDAPGDIAPRLLEAAGNGRYAGTHRGSLLAG